MDLLLEFGVHAYFHGHVHQLQHQVLTGDNGWSLEVFNSGAGGVLPDPFSPLPSHDKWEHHRSTTTPRFSTQQPGILDLAVGAGDEMGGIKQVVGTFYDME